MTTYTVTKVRKELSADKSHEHIEGVCTTDGTHYTRQQVVDSIDAAPTNAGIQFSDVFTVWIAGSGGDNSVINGVGGPDTSPTRGTSSRSTSPATPDDSRLT